MSVRKTLLAVFVSLVILFSASSCNLFGAKPTQTAEATAVPTEPPITTAAPIAVSDPNFLIGLWKGEYASSEVIMTFDANGNVSIAVYGNLQGGTYTLNTDTTPYQLDFIIKDVGTIQTIVEFVDSNTVKIENVYPGIERPSTFNDFFLLTRSTN